MGSALSGFLSAAKTSYPTNATTAIIKRICFMLASLRLTGTGVNAVGGYCENTLSESTRPHLARMNR